MKQSTCCSDEITEPCVSLDLILLPLLPTPLSLLPPLDDEDDPCVALISEGVAGRYPYPIVVDDDRAIVGAVATIVVTPPATDDDDIIVDGDSCEHDACVVLISEEVAGRYPYPIVVDDVRAIVGAVATIVATPPATDDDDDIVDGDSCELVAVEMGENVELGWLSAGEDS